MPTKRNSTADLDPENTVDQPRRSSRVTSKPNSFSSSHGPTTKATKTPKENGAKVKQTTKTSTKSADASGEQKPDTASLSDLSSLGDGEKSEQDETAKKGELEQSFEGASEEAAKEANYSEDRPSAHKKAKIYDGDSTGKSKPTITKVAVGDKLVESIVLRNEDDVEVDIVEAVRQKGAVIFIYPKANTPGCTNQACGFRDIYQEIVDAGYQVFGLSMDSPKSQKNWKDKKDLQYNLLCDPKQHLIRVLGASKSATQVQRSHYIIAAGGEILNITSPASPKDGPQKALDFIKNL